MSAVKESFAAAPDVNALVEAAHHAQVSLAAFDQAKVNRICEAMSRAALENAARLGAMAVEETGFGIADDKREKNRFASEDVWNYFKNLRTVGTIAESKDVIEIASPRGVIAAIIPSTNPTSTAIFKILIAVKSRNAIVLSPHPSAAKCISETARVMREVAIREGLPADAIACIANSTIEATETLMKHKLTALILATGGIGLVRAAYSSGKPAFGVGPGNVPVFIERTADVGTAIQNILTGKCFDNGTICASEQAIVTDRAIAAEARAHLEAQGAKFLSNAEAEQLARVVATEKRTLNPAIVGKSVQHIAQLAGLNVSPDTRCLVAEVAGVGRDYPLSMEKLSPILAFYVADGLEQGAARCFEILSYGGMGHTAGIHTRSREAARSFGEQMPASRVIVNSPTTHGAIGFSTALPPSMTLGCGSWGGNVTSDNISPLHLMDIKRVAFETRPVASKRPASGINLNDSSTNFASSTALSSANTPNVSREQITAIVDRFLQARGINGATSNASTYSNGDANNYSNGAPQPLPVTSSPAPQQPLIDIGAKLSANNPPAPSPQSAPTAQSITNDATSTNGASSNIASTNTVPNNLTANAQDGINATRENTTTVTTSPTNNATSNIASTNGKPKTVDFVCEDDVRRAIETGAKIYITARTIITPSARDAGEAAEVFAK